MPTILHRLSKWAEESPEAAAQRYKSGGEWKVITAREFSDRVFYLASFLESRGFGAEDVSAIFAYNSPEWVQMDLAAMLLRGKSAGLYPNSAKKDVDFILGHTEAKVFSVQNREYFDKVTQKGQSSLPEHIALVVVFDGDTSISPKAVSFADALAEGKARAAASGRTLSSYLDRVDPQDGAFLIYTSGTTGVPKGALLTHDNLAFTSDLVRRTWRLPTGGNWLFSFLPLCHIAEKLQNVGVGISCRYVVSFATKFDNVATEIGEVQPTLLLSVPRLWEKMMSGVESKVAGSKGMKKLLAQWAFEVSASVAEKRYSGKGVSAFDQIRLRLADKLVLSKVRKALGFERLWMAASGAAALPAHVGRWFRSLGIEILEDFGQTESTGVICMTLPGVDCLGTVGKPVEGVEVRIAADGELVTRGRHVFKEYFKSAQATSETIVDGWLHTGDLAELTEKGMIRIRGRKKEIMKSSGGKMIAPVPIEERIKQHSLISQACLVGDGRKYFSALITLAEHVERGEDEVVTKPEILSSVRAHVDEINRQLASFERIKYFTVLGRDFSVETGEMTPTMKMKRNVIEERYRTVIDKMYRDSAH